MVANPLIATGVSALRLGNIGTGPIATVEAGGVVRLLGDRSDVRWSWWIGAEDRWHRPSLEPQTRDDVADGAPVLTTTARIPGGDFVGTTGAAHLDALGGASVLCELDNRSAVPVAIAFVVETERAMTVRAGGIDIDGVGSLRLTRPAAASLSAPSADELQARLVAGDQGTIADGTSVRGAVALVVPLPHAAHALAAIVEGDGACELPAHLDRQSLPRAEQLLRGWSAHLGSSPTLTSGVDRRDVVARSATADVLVGTDWNRTSAYEVALVAEAVARLGRVDLFEALDTLLDDQKSNGSFEDDDAVGATAQFVRAIGATWSGGASPESGERLLEAAALSVHWLSKRKNRSEVATRSSEVSFAIESIIGLAEDLGQDELADRLRAQVRELGIGSPLLGRRADQWVADLGAGYGFGDQVAQVGASAALAIRSTCELVVERADGVDIAAGYEPELAGRELDVRQLPTRWGILSFSLRWHGRRPAVLWELTPWKERTPVRPFTLTASAIDPTWQAHETEGEALLAQPANAEFEMAPEFVHEHLLSESSDGHSHGDWNAVPDFGETTEQPEGGTFS